MGILSWIIVGGIAGWLGGLLMQGGGFGLLGNIIIGIAGGLIGGWLAGALFNVPDAMTGINLTSILVAFLGAIVLIFIIRLLRGGRRTG
ncbi:MAG: GlsB/YeaQ/YmgE family stress response membrane protein [Thermoflexales bacterium]